MKARKKLLAVLLCLTVLLGGYTSLQVYRQWDALGLVLKSGNLPLKSDNHADDIYIYLKPVHRKGICLSALMILEGVIGPLYSLFLKNMAQQLHTLELPETPIFPSLT